MRSTNFILSTLIAFIAFICIASASPIPMIRASASNFDHPIQISSLKKRLLNLLNANVLNGSDIGALGGQVNDINACGNAGQSSGGGGLLNLGVLNGSNLALLGGGVNKMCVPPSAVGGNGEGVGGGGVGASASASANAGSMLGGIL